MRHARAGRQHLGTFARGHAPDRRLVVVPEDRSETLDLLVRLEPGHFVAGRVVDHAGNGLHRIRITPLAADAGRHGDRPRGLHLT